MVHTRRTRLQVLSFEDRTVPAVDPGVVLDISAAGVLSGVHEAATGQSDAVTLSVLPGNRMTVHEGATDLGTFRVGNRLRIDLGSHTGGFINHLELNDNLLKTNLDVNLGGEMTQFRILGGLTGVATIDGNVNVRGGAGSQYFLFGEKDDPTPHVTNVTGSLKVDMGPGGDGPEAVGTVGPPPAPSSANVAGNVTVRNSNIFVWAGRIGGNLTVDSAKPPFQWIFLGNYNRPMTIGGNVSIRTGDSPDEVDFQATLVGRNATVHTGGGDDLVQFGMGDDDDNNIGFNDVPATILGKLDVDLGTGNDKVYFGADSLRNPGQTNPLTVGGSMTVDAGLGDDHLFFLDARVHGRSISIDAGEGADEVNVAKLTASAAKVSVDMGKGDDTFGFKDNATVSLKRAVIDGDLGNDLYVAGANNNFDFPIDRTSI